MTNILLCGACGKMGHAVARSAGDFDRAQIAAGYDIKVPSDASFPVYTSLADIKEQIDVIIDFSPSVLSRFSASAVVSPFLVVWFSVSFFSSISSTMYLPFRFFGFCLCLHHMRTSPKKEPCVVA